MILILITKHRQLGFVAEFRQTGPATDEVSSAGNIEAIKELTALSLSFSDSEIHRRFSRKNATLRDFLNHLDGELLLTQIRPFIDRQMDKMFRLAIQHDIHIYFQEGPARENPSLLLSAEPSLAEPWFCFTKRENGSDYVLELYQNEHRINLREKEMSSSATIPAGLKPEKDCCIFRRASTAKNFSPFLQKILYSFPHPQNRNISGVLF